MLVRGPGNACRGCQLSRLRTPSRAARRARADQVLERRPGECVLETGPRSQPFKLSHSLPGWSQIRIGDEQMSALATTAAAEVKATPYYGTFTQQPPMSARVVRHTDCVAVSVLDLTGSQSGSWQERTGPGHCQRVTIMVLLDQPGRWVAEAAVLGRDGDRFGPVPITQRPHREGTAIEIELPVAAGWSVLRLTPAGGG